MTNDTIEERLFGTDGIRGRYGKGWLAPDPVSRLGRAIGLTLGESSGGGRRARALVGHDGRRSGPILEAAVARGLASAGLDVSSCGLTTTPALALLGRQGPFALTVMISASHNPASDNGIKVFGPEGQKLDDDTERRIESTVRGIEGPIADGPAPALDPALEEGYLDHLARSFAGLELAGLTIALDCANGGGSRVGPRILGRLGAHVHAIACSPDGENINQDCGSTQPGALQDAVRMNSADLGIALDGDGDRCILVDEHGSLVEGDAILTLLARHAVDQGDMPDRRIVATVMSNKGLHRALREVGVGVVTVGVGDRQVVDALRAERLSLGGEQSGHIIFGADNHFIGDGLFTALRVLQALRARDVSLSALAAPFRAFPQVLVNVPVVEKPDLATLPALQAAVEAIEDTLGEDGRVLLRYSGTEPLARVMVEGPDEGSIRAQAQELAALISRELGA